MAGMTGVVAAVFLGLFLAASPSPAQEAGKETAEARLAEQGEAIFQQKCISCHSIGGGDRPTGPDLAGVTQRREREWVLGFILDPGGMIARDPAARQMAQKYPMAMPDMGLSQAEAEALLAFLARPGEAEHRAGEAVAPPAPGAAAPGDPRHGEALYIGSAPFSKGGAPCLACHGIAGHGLAGGASYGPDLTSTYGNYGDELFSVLASMPFPSMEPVYAGRPLTEKEIRDLTAFLAEVSGETPRVAGPLARDAAIGAAVFFAAALAFGWRRLRGVRRQLVEEARKPAGREAP